MKFVFFCFLFVVRGGGGGDGGGGSKKKKEEVEAEKGEHLNSFLLTILLWCHYLEAKR